MASSQGAVAALRAAVRPWLVLFLLLADTRAALIVNSETSEKSRTQTPRSPVNTTEEPQHSEKPIMTDSESENSKQNDDKTTSDSFELTSTAPSPVIEIVTTENSFTSSTNEAENVSERAKIEDDLSTSDVIPESNITAVPTISSKQNDYTTKRENIFQATSHNIPHVAVSDNNPPFRSRRHPPATRQPEPVRDPSKFRYTTFSDEDPVSSSETDSSTPFSPTDPLYGTTITPQDETTESYQQQSEDERSENSEARFDVPKDESSSVSSTSESADSERRTEFTSECSIEECGVDGTSANSVTIEPPAATCSESGATCGSDGSPRNDTETTTAAPGTAEVPWPVKMAAELPGDLILGGLMMVHEREESVTCGPVMPQGGVQALEAMLFTLDVLNADPSLIPNVTLGAHILDDCDKDTYGLEMAVDFIKGFSNDGVLFLPDKRMSPNLAHSAGFASDGRDLLCKQNIPGCQRVAPLYCASADACTGLEVYGVRNVHHGLVLSVLNDARNCQLHYNSNAIQPVGGDYPDGIMQHSYQRSSPHYSHLAAPASACRGDSRRWFVRLQ